MGTVIAFRSRAELQASKRPPRPTRQAPLAHLPDDTLRAAHEELMLSDYSEPSDTKVVAALELEMKRRGIEPLPWVKD